MATQTQRRPKAADPDAPPRPTKKDQILALAAAGVNDVADIALMTQTRPSYVGTVLQDAGRQPAYFDLYTSTNRPMNAYSKFFAGQLGFKDVDAARKSVELIDRLYRQFELAADRAGQHHALLMALTMFDRARWTNKAAEAEVFRRWLADRLAAAVQPEQPQTAVRATPGG